MTKRRDDILARIEAFNATKGGGVIIRKAAGGYSLFRADNGRPVARLRPTGKGDQVVGRVVEPSRQVGPDRGLRADEQVAGRGAGVRREGSDGLLLALIVRDTKQKILFNENNSRAKCDA